jgi:hypothetical protein
VPFIDPDPYQEFRYPNMIAAKRAIAENLGTPLGKLSPSQLERIDAIVAATLNKQEVLARVREYMNRSSQEPQRSTPTLAGR